MALTALAVLAMPVNGAHLHLCFDGSEPPTTVHLIEDGDDHYSDASLDGAHRDADVSLDGVALAKKFDGALDLPSLLTAVLLMRVPVEAPVLLPDLEVPVAAATSIVRRLPPLRGPPV